jgi:SAM-dependent methyltransferase
VTAPDDCKQVVADGYDRIAEQYAVAGRSRPDPMREKYLRLAMQAAPPGARALDLGCGTGELATALLASRYDVVGVDISPRSVAFARGAVPRAEFVVADIAATSFGAASFDVVTAFFSLIHLPGREQLAVVAAIANWLRPGGTFIATFDAADAGESYAADWLGVPMVWASAGRTEVLEALQAAGFATISAAVEAVDEGSAVALHLWIVARRPS